MLSERHIQLAKIYFAMVFGGGAAYYVGLTMDRQTSLRYVRFRDKSALFGRELKPGEPPSWP